MITTVNFDAMTGKLKLEKPNLKIKTETFSLTRENIDSKIIILSKEPANSVDIVFLPEEGISQRKGIDFNVLSNIVSWDGLGLDGFLEINEVVNITYYYY